MRIVSDRASPSRPLWLADPAVNVYERGTTETRNERGEPLYTNNYLKVSRLEPRDHPAEDGKVALDGEIAKVITADAGVRNEVLDRATSGLDSWWPPGNSTGPLSPRHLWTQLDHVGLAGTRL